MSLTYKMLQKNFVDEPANHSGFRTDKSEWISDAEIALYVRKQLIFTTFW